MAPEAARVSQWGHMLSPRALYAAHGRTRAPQGWRSRRDRRASERRRLIHYGMGFLVWGHAAGREGREVEQGECQDG